MADDQARAALSALLSHADEAWWRGDGSRTRIEALTDAIIAARWTPPGAAGTFIAIDYTNHRGERAIRRVRPISFRVGKSEWHEGIQMLMLAFDPDKGEEGEVREFAVDDIHEWGAALHPAAIELAAEVRGMERAAGVAEGFARARKGAANGKDFHIAATLERCAEESITIAKAIRADAARLSVSAGGEKGDKVKSG